MSKANHLKVFLLLLALGFLGFYFLGFYKLYFQQDEWRSFGHYIYLLSTVGKWGAYKSFLGLHAVHYTPLNSMLHFSLFMLFGLKANLWISFTLLLHSINSYLVFVLCNKITKSRSYSIFAALLFMFMYAGRQAFTWFGVSTNTLPATTFGLLSVIFFLNHLETKKSKPLYYALSLLILSLLFKEITIGLFGLYLLYPLQKKIKNYYSPKNKIITITLLFYVFARLILLLSPSEAPVVKSSQSITNKRTLVINTLLYPIKSVSQTIVPVKLEILSGEIVYDWAPVRNKYKVGTHQRDLFVQNYLVTFIDIAIFILLIWYLRRHPKIKYARFLFLLVILNSFIYTLSPERSGSITLIDSRNLYFQSTAIAVLLAVFISRLKKNHANMIFAFIITANLLVLSLDLVQKTRLARVQTYILQTIKSDNPTLNPRTVFYIESDSPYFGLPQNVKIPPFQAGMGKILLVSYYPQVIFPPDFYQHEFLWDIDSQDYLEKNNYLFGYYREPNNLKDFYKNHSDVTLISYKFFSSLNRIKDSKDETLQYLLK